MITMHALEKFFERVLLSKVDNEFLEKSFYQSSQYLHSFFDKSKLVYRGYLHLNDKDIQKYYIYDNIVFVTSDKEAILTCYKITDLSQEEISSYMKLISDIGSLVDETKESIIKSKNLIDGYKDLREKGIVSSYLIQSEIDALKRGLSDDKLRLESLKIIHRIFAKSLIMGKNITHDYKKQVVGVYKHELYKLQMFDILNSNKLAILEDYIINKL